MDSKKKRNKKKKGNQGKNTDDVTSNAGEAAPQHHNHESAPTDHHKGSDADDAMSSVGEGMLQYQNHEPTLQADHNGTNAHDTTSSMGEGIPCYQNNEIMTTQRNHKASNALPADQRSVGMSESSVELDMQRLCEVKLDKMHETIKQLEDEKSLWLQKVNIMEAELEKLQSKVGFHAQNEVLLEEKLNSLQNDYNVLVKKEEVLESEFRRMDDKNCTLTHKEALLKERLNGLEETNKALLVQVNVLEESSNNSFEENQVLVKRLDELDSRLQALEEKAAVSEASMFDKVAENKVMDRMDLTGPFVHQQAIGFTEVVNQGNKLIAEKALSSHVEIISDSNYSQINNSPSNAYQFATSNNSLQETSIHVPEIATNNSIVRGHIDVNGHQFVGPRISEDTVPVLLDDIQIHEDDSRQPRSEDEIEEVPFSDAPIIGAPFRLISFVARYVSGADLVNQK